MDTPAEVRFWIGNLLATSPQHLRFSPLASGANAEAFLVESDAGRRVLKRYRQGCDTDRQFEAWCERIRGVPRHVNVEQLIGGRRIDGAAYALFTFVPGRTASLADNPLTRPQLDALFQCLLPSLDLAGFLNHDLNLGNLLTTENDVGLIDLEYLDTFSPTPSRKLRWLLNSDFWDCPIPANRVSLEREGIGPYLEALVSQPSGGSKAGAWFGEYLAASAPYHAQRAEWLGALGQPALAEAVEYEQVRAEALRSPEPDLVRSEALRLQVYFDAFARTLYVDWRGHPDRSEGIATLLAIQADADAFMAEADRLLAEAAQPAPAARLIALHRNSVGIMRRVLAGDASRGGGFPEFLRGSFGERVPPPLEIVRWLREAQPKEVFVPTGWSVGMSP